MFIDYIHSLTKFKLNYYANYILGHSFVHVEVNAPIKQTTIGSVGSPRHGAHELVRAKVDSRCNSKQKLQVIHGLAIRCFLS